MKKIFILFASIWFSAGVFAQNISVDAENARKSFSDTVTLTPKDHSVTISKGKIILAPKKEGSVYTVSGYFNGQIVNKTKNTVIKLNNAFIENSSGGTAIYGEAKTEVSSVNGTVNYVVSSGKSPDKTAALYCKKNVEIGGGGTIHFVGNVCHAVKGDDVKLKGSGVLYFQGTNEGSGINCENLIVEKEKSFKAYFLNSKNGIKADCTIDVSSGNFFFTGNKTALKTDTKKDDPKSQHSITLSGGTISLSANETFYKTEQNAYKAKGAKIIQE